MKVTLQRQLVGHGGAASPCLALEPERISGGVLLIHSYGGNKEEVSGMAWRLAEAGLGVCCPDLRGHGENPLPMDEGIMADVEGLVGFCRKWGTVAALGHSLGGRLALLSSADFTLGISPALHREFSEKTHKAVTNLRDYRVRWALSDPNFAMLKKLPLWKPVLGIKSALLLGTRDTVEITEACLEHKARGVRVLEIPNALHGDIMTLEPAIKEVIGLLKEWFA